MGCNITYYGNSAKKEEIWFDDTTDELHRTDGAAYLLYDEFGRIKLARWFNQGVEEHYTVFASTWSDDFKMTDEDKKVFNRMKKLKADMRVRLKYHLREYD